MEFVSPDEIVDLLDEYGIDKVVEGTDKVHLRMNEGEGVVHICLADQSCADLVSNGSQVLGLPKEQLPRTLEHIMRVLHLSQVLMVPVGKWRKVFDAVAFSMAGNQAWQEIDASATVELNTRDPLLCGPADMHLLIELISALIRDAESPDQSVMFVATASPVLVEVMPAGAIRLSIGSQALADEVTDIFAKKA